MEIVRRIGTEESDGEVGRTVEEYFWESVVLGVFGGVVLIRHWKW